MPRPSTGIIVSGNFGLGQVLEQLSTSEFTYPSSQMDCLRSRSLAGVIKLRIESARVGVVDIG